MRFELVSTFIGCVHNSRIIMMTIIMMLLSVYNKDDCRR